MSKKLEDLKQYLEKMNRFGHVVTLLQWDMRTGMPKGGLEKHVDAVAHFSTEQFQMSVAEELGNLLEVLMMQSEYDALDDTWKFIVKKIRLSSNLKIVDDFSMYNIVDSSAFNYCENLVELVIPQGCETVSGFYGCTNLEQLKLPSSVKYVGEFGDCKKLQDFDIPDGVEELGNFAGCESLTQVIMPDSITFFRGFADCINVKKVVISKGIDSLNSFDFAGCSSLAEIYIPSSVWVVDIEAFKGCPDTMIVYGEAGSGAARALSYKYTFKIIE